jgi:hypothetical protein
MGARMRLRGIAVVAWLLAGIGPLSAASLGSGFFVSPAGHVLTNYHVVRGCTTTDVFDADTTKQTGRVVAVDQRNDLALVETGRSPKAVAEFGGSGAKVGENIWAFGFPLAGLLATSGNFSGGIVAALAGLDNDSRMLQISAPVQPGSSGGPLLDQNGVVVGIVVAKLNALGVAKVTNDLPQNVNFAIKAAIAVDFLEANNVTPRIASDAKALEQTDIAERAKSISVKIICADSRQPDEEERTAVKSGSGSPKNDSGGLEQANPKSGESPVSEVSIDDMVGRWCGDHSNYTFSRTGMVVTPVGNWKLTHAPHWTIDRVEADGNQVEVFWKPAKPGNSTAFELRDDGDTLIQLPQTAGDKGPRRVFHRC